MNILVHFFFLLGKQDKEDDDLSAAFAFNTGLLPLSGGEIASTFDHPELVKLGHCKLIEEVMIGEDTLIHFSGVEMGKYLYGLLNVFFIRILAPPPCNYCDKYI